MSYRVKGIYLDTTFEVNGLFGPRWNFGTARVGIGHSSTRKDFFVPHWLVARETDGKNLFELSENSSDYRKCLMALENEAFHIKTGKTIKSISFNHSATIRHKEASIEGFWRLSCLNFLANETKFALPYPSCLRLTSLAFRKTLTKKFCSLRSLLF